MYQGEIIFIKSNQIKDIRTKKQSFMNLVEIFQNLKFHENDSDYSFEFEALDGLPKQF